MEIKHKCGGVTFAWNYEPENKDSVWKIINDEIIYEKESRIEKKVIYLLKGGFEEVHGISISEFFRISKKIMDTKPELFI